jgi:hypothetical protein
MQAMTLQLQVQWSRIMRPFNLENSTIRDGSRPQIARKIPRAVPHSEPSSFDYPQMALSEEEGLSSECPGWMVSVKV